MRVAVMILSLGPTVRTILLGLGCWVLVSLVATALFVWLVSRNRTSSHCEEEE